MWCEFQKIYPKSEWTKHPRGQSKRLTGPAYGEPSGDNHPIGRCPHCNKRLRYRADYCIGGEFAGWCLPDHKAKEKLVKKSPKRKSKVNGRGR